MTTVLDKELRRQIRVGEEVYTVSLDADGFRLIGKGRRKPEVALRWSDLLSGDTALAAALNASLLGHPAHAVHETPGHPTGSAKPARPSRRGRKAQSD
jgi:hypothetical protein